jgi:pimeloyl-ACP methyl ester carboxylesterase
MANIRMSPALSGGLILLSTATPVAAAGTCTSGWTGQISYTRAFATSTSESGRSISSDGTVTKSSSVTADYSAQVAVQAGAEPGSSIGRANINYSSSARDGQSKTIQSRCAGERTMRTMHGETFTESIVRGTGSAVEADVAVSIDEDGLYSVSVGLPQIAGVASGSTRSTFSGQCSPMRGGDAAPGEVPTSIDGYRFGSDGSTRVASNSPDQLSGSYSTTSLGLTETLTWSLKRCASAVRFVDLKLEDMKFPTWEAWQDIIEQRGTTDGNIVRVTAIVANDGVTDASVTVKLQETYKGDKGISALPDKTLDELSVDIPAGQSREVQFKWDSSGYAWYDDGRPRLTQRIRADLIHKGKKVEEKDRTLKVTPKPLVLVHGLWSNWTAWEPWQTYLTALHSYDWKAFPVGEKPEHGRMRTGEAPGNFGPTNTIEQNAAELRRYIDYAQKDRNAWHVDLVAHSMGGLISRRYIHASMPRYQDGRPQVSHLVMLGTPNMGSPCADVATAVLGESGRSMMALQELRQDSVAQFNSVNVNRKGVPFSIAAGNPVYGFCYTLDWNDGVVAVPSAIWTIADNAKLGFIHTSLTQEEPLSSFVKPRVAIGPGKMVPDNGAATFRMPVDSQAGTGAEQVKDASGSPRFSRIVKVAAGETLDVPLPVVAGPNLGVTFIAAPGVSVTLTDDKGAVAATSNAGSPGAAQPFRSLIVDRAVSRGDWNLTFKNETKGEQEVLLSAGATPS